MQELSEKREQIIKASELLFQKYGYPKTSLDDIAKEAGLGKGTIYYYFDSKEQIFFEVVKEQSTIFYDVLKKEVQKQTNFTDKFSTIIKLPLKLVYKHAPILVEALKSLPENYMQKVISVKEANKKKIVEILSEVIYYGIDQNQVTKNIPVDKLVSIIFDWFLLGDSNIVVKNPDAFIKKAMEDYDAIIKLMLNGILIRG